jgi:hypothetical protein
MIAGAPLSLYREGGVRGQSSPNNRTQEVQRVERKNGYQDQARLRYLDSS